MMEKPNIPNFSNEAEEAEWWYENREWLNQEFLRAAKEGKLKRGSTVMERLLARQSSSLSVPLSSDELAKIHDLAQRRGMEDAMFARDLLHKALDREEEQERRKAG
jgi:predicted DNA binding CopG/RHH family protein